MSGNYLDEPHSGGVPSVLRDPRDPRSLRSPRSPRSLLIEHIFPPFHRPGRQPQRNDENERQRYETRRCRRWLRKQRLNRRDRIVLRHRVRHERLQVMGNSKTSQVAGHEKRHLFPSENEYESGDQWSRHERANEREYRAIDTKTHREQPKISQKLKKRPADAAS